MEKIIKPRRKYNLLALFLIITSILLSGCYSKFAENCVIKYLLTCCLIDYVRRLVPIFQASWVQVDVLLDARQTWTYFNHADSNGTYADWAKEFRERTNSTYEHSVSPGYCITGMVVWFLTPLLLALSSWIASNERLVFLRGLLDKKFDR